MAVVQSAEPSGRLSAAGWSAMDGRQMPTALQRPEPSGQPSAGSWPEPESTNGALANSEVPLGAVAKVQFGLVLGIGVSRTLELQADNLKLPNLSIPFSSITKVEREGTQICIHHSCTTSKSQRELKFDMESKAVATSWKAAILSSASTAREAIKRWSSCVCPSGHEIKARRAQDETQCQLCRQSIATWQHLMFCETCSADFCARCRSVYHGRWLSDKGMKVEVYGDYARFADGSRAKAKADADTGLCLVYPGKELRQSSIDDSKAKIVVCFPSVRCWSHADHMPKMRWRRPSNDENAAWMSSPQDVGNVHAANMPSKQLRDCQRRAVQHHLREQRLSEGGGEPVQDEPPLRAGGSLPVLEEGVLGNGFEVFEVEEPGEGALGQVAIEDSFSTAL